MTTAMGSAARMQLVEAVQPEAASLQATVVAAQGATFLVHSRARRVRWGSPEWAAPVDTEAYTLSGGAGWQDAFMALDVADALLVCASVANGNVPSATEFRLVTRTKEGAPWVPVATSSGLAVGVGAVLQSGELAMQVGVQVRNVASDVGQVSIGLTKVLLP